MHGSPFLIEVILDEKDAEIESLKREVAFMASNDYVYSLTSEIERLKARLGPHLESSVPEKRLAG